MTVSRTTNFNLPLPVPSNLLADDVVSLRDALTTIDTLLNDRVTAASVTSTVNTAISSLVDGAPATLDTLNELAAAINDDPDVFATLTTDITANNALLAAQRALEWDAVFATHGSLYATTTTVG